MADTSSNSTGFLPGENGYNQSIRLLFPDGSPFNVSMVDLTVMNSVNIGMAITYGIQIGLAFIMLIVTLLVTQKAKRWSLIFVCNVAALALDIPCSVLITAWLASIWNNPYVYFTHDTSRISRGNVVTSILPQPFKLLEIIAIQLSIITQVRVVLITSPAFFRRCIIAVIFTLSLITMSMEIGLSVVNAKQIAGMADPLPIQPRLAQAANIMLCIFIACAMLVFIWKLAYALKNRRNLGLVNFGPMQVIFIMGVQTMVGPSEFSPVLSLSPSFSLVSIQPTRLISPSAILLILNIVLPIDLAGLAITITAVTLPLSGLWAATSLEPANQQPSQYRAAPLEFPFKDIDNGLSGTTKTSESELLDLGNFLNSEDKGKGFEV
jgi:pheromone alpha factor receptor